MTDDRRAAGLQFVREAFSDEMAERIGQYREANSFGAEMADMAVENVFGGLWVRPGLDRRARSLLTVGILIALRATDELRIHTLAAVRNGVTVNELEEALYHATAYAGFPAANSAGAVMREVLREQKLID